MVDIVLPGSPDLPDEEVVSSGDGGDTIERSFALIHGALFADEDANELECARVYGDYVTCIVAHGSTEAVLDFDEFGERMRERASQATGSIPVETEAARSPEAVSAALLREARDKDQAQRPVHIVKAAAQPALQLVSLVRRACRAKLARPAKLGGERRPSFDAALTLVALLSILATIALLLAAVFPAAVLPAP